jgi:hypothetical protein
MQSIELFRISERIVLSIGLNWVGSTWRRRQNPVSETLCVLNKKGLLLMYTNNPIKTPIWNQLCILSVTTQHSKIWSPQLCTASLLISIVSCYMFRLMETIVRQVYIISYSQTIELLSIYVYVTILQLLIIYLISSIR